MTNPQGPIQEELLLFEQSGQLYALPASTVREVLRAFSAVPLPGAPTMVEGVLNVRGEIIALLNLQRRFGLPDRPLSLLDHFVIAWEGTRWVALRVDRVINLLRLPTKNAADAGRYIAKSDVIGGVAISPDGMVLIHDLGRFLTQAERDLLSNAMAPSASTGPLPPPASSPQKIRNGGNR